MHFYKFQILLASSVKISDFFSTSNSAQRLPRPEITLFNEKTAKSKRNIGTAVLHLTIFYKLYSIRIHPTM